MKITKDISLRNYNTFHVDYRAQRLMSIEKEDEAASFFSASGIKSGKVLIIGSGSNILFTEYFNGTVIHSIIEGIRIVEKHKDYIVVKAGSGVIWDRLVDWSVEMGYGGLENLSLIPGTVGASPVQNIGAYGAEAGDLIEKVRAVSISDGSVTEFNNRDCMFGYRESIFKNEMKGKLLVTSVSYRLKISPELKTGYGSLEEEVMKIGERNLRNVRQAVINIRTRKLPDPDIIGNAGSFFKNPLIPVSEADALKTEFPDMPVFNDVSGRIKLPAGWLIEKCGWKGKRSGDAGVYENQSLVLVNYGYATGEEIFRLSEEIKMSVKNKFGIELEREVEVI